MIIATTTTIMLNSNPKKVTCLIKALTDVKVFFFFFCINELLAKHSQKHFFPNIVASIMLYEKEKKKRTF